MSLCALSKILSLYLKGTTSCLRMLSPPLIGFTRISLYNRSSFTQYLSGFSGIRGSSLACLKHSLNVGSSFCSCLKDGLLGFLMVTRSAVSLLLFQEEFHCFPKGLQFAIPEGELSLKHSAHAQINPLNMGQDFDHIWLLSKLLTISYILWECLPWTTLLFLIQSL